MAEEQAAPAVEVATERFQGPGWQGELIAWAVQQKLLMPGDGNIATDTIRRVVKEKVRKPSHRVQMYEHICLTVDMTVLGMLIHTEASRLVFDAWRRGRLPLKPGRRGMYLHKHVAYRNRRADLAMRQLVPLLEMAAENVLFGGRGGPTVFDASHRYHNVIRSLHFVQTREAKLDETQAVDGNMSTYNSFRQFIGGFVRQQARDVLYPLETILRFTVPLAQRHPDVYGPMKVMEDAFLHAVGHIPWMTIATTHRRNEFHAAWNMDTEWEREWIATRVKAGKSTDIPMVEICNLIVGSGPIEPRVVPIMFPEILATPSVPGHLCGAQQPYAAHLGYEQHVGFHNNVLAGLQVVDPERYPDRELALLLSSEMVTFTASLAAPALYDGFGLRPSMLSPEIISAYNDEATRPFGEKSPLVFTLEETPQAARLQYTRTHPPFDVCPAGLSL